MPKDKDLLRLMRDVTAFCDEYRSANVDPAHRRADNIYHGIHENLADYQERGRSSLYIPKVRNHVRKWTSTIVNAFMASDDLVTVSYPVVPEKERFTNEVVNRRLERDCNFFMFLANAAHSHIKYGNAVGKTGWEYSEEVVRTEEYVDPESGESVKEDVTAPTTDRPFFDVIPFENVQVDYRCIGSDPVNESPFFRHWIPMYVTDIEKKFADGEWKRPRGLDWKNVTIPDTTALVRGKRHGEKHSPDENGIGTEPDNAPLSYSQAWVVENYFRISGTDWTFLSIGDEGVITKSERVIDKFAHGKRPFAISKFDPEAFRVVSDGLPEIEKNLQYEVNAIRNQRRDNVGLVLNAGHYVRRGAGIQLSSLVNSRPGRIILGDSINDTDIRREEVADITASAYREEEVANRDLEECSNHSSNMLGVADSNRTTATEAAISASASGEMEGYVIKAFVETFVRPLLEMYMDNIIAYENDERTLVEASVVTGLPPDPELLARGEVIINAGMGSTNKEIKSARLQAIIDRAIQLAAVDPAFINAAKEGFREWLPLSGFKNPARFIPAAPSAPQGALPQGEQPPGAPGMQGQPAAEIPQNANLDPQLQAVARQVPGIGGFARGMLQ